jgi:uncharacterized protein (TIGR02452 family)
MTLAVQPNIFQQCITNVNAWTEKHPKAALITTIACAALGIICTAVVAKVTLASAAAIALTCTAVAAFSVSLALILSYVMGTSAKKEPTPNPTVIVPEDPVPQKRMDLVKVMQETLQDIKNGYYIRADGVKVQLPLNDCFNAADYVHEAGPKEQRIANPRSRIGRPNDFQTIITVAPKDCLYVACELLEEGLHPILLDLANAVNPGGNYLGGARSQEEEICRRSGLCKALDQQHGFQKKNFYPINPAEAPYRGIFVPGVPVFRAGADRQYGYLEEHFRVDVAVIAAPCRPALIDVNGHLRINDQDAALMRERIRTTLHMAHAQGNNAVVLGALGCGAFYNPPEHVAQIFKEVIEQEFAHCFEKIVFAVLKDGNDGHAHNPEGNYVPFKRVFPD